MELDIMNQEIIYFESNRKTDIIKKIYRNSPLDTNINILFWNSYWCKLNASEYAEFVNNINIPFAAYMQDMRKLSIIKQQELPLIIDN